MKKLTLTLLLLILIRSPIAAQIADWQRTSGPYGGDVYALVKADNGTIIAGSYLGGLFRSEDDGQTWQRIDGERNDWFLFDGVYDLVKNSQGHLFAATNQGVFRSLDNGDTWEVFYEGLTNNFVRALAINSADVIFAGSNNQGVFRSEDNGETWVQFNNGLTSLTVQCLAVNLLGDVFAGTGNGLFKSSDNGDNWALVSESFVSDNITELYVTPEDSLFAGTYDGMYRSADFGAQWKHVIPYSIVASMTRDTENELYAGGGGYFWRSPDIGNNWNRADSLLKFGSFQDLLSLPSGKLVAATINYGVMQSADSGDTWQQTVTGLGATEINSLIELPSGTIIAGTYDGLYKTTDGGENWTLHIDPLMGTYCRYIIRLESGRLVGRTGSILVLSDDDGETWAQVDSSLSLQFPEAVTESPSGDVYVVFYSGEVFKSSNNGDTWMQLAMPVPSTTLQAIGVGNDGTIYAGTQLDGVFRSQDDGLSWEHVITDTLSRNSRFLTFKLAENGNELAVGFDGVFRTSDSGATWKKLGQVPTPGLYDLAIDATGNMYIVSRGGGVAVSEDQGETWKSINNGLLHLDTKTLLIASDGAIYAGTRGGGVFKTHFLPTNVTKDAGEFPVSFSLDHNYPNPFNPTTVISYQLSATGVVNLSIFNIKGQLVRTVVSGKQASGYQHVQWDGRNNYGQQVSSGVYLYRLRAGEQVQTRRMVLMK
ncbi:T9SS type A sorting domain-containing protein [candidate division KSB1 bacterium]|nr:T9SS type A sorting domain-containing protein [candidate division KSB1 bacterium]